MKLKAEARLNLLRDVGVAVDTWIKSAMNQVMEELENERWATMTTHDASLSVSENITSHTLIVINKRVKKKKKKSLVRFKPTFHLLLEHSRF